ncbi:MAG: cysteine desulfurase-like protein [Anaerolineaceae bacterium]
MKKPYDIKAVRAEFPALSKPVVFLDNPGGTQIAQRSINRIVEYLIDTNANHGGAFPTSASSDLSVEAARAAMADFLNASRPDEIVFGANMTTLTMNFSRVLARTFDPGDTIVVTHLDHDANISPWLLAAEDRGCKVRWVDVNPEDCTLDLEDFKQAMKEKPKLVAFGYASNFSGTINPVDQLVPLAHAAGALVYIDAVQYAPHGQIDVQRLGCDFLVCSSYKFFGPHLGILYGRYELLEKLRAYRVRPAPQNPPGKFETGTGNFEHMAGAVGALDHIEWVGETFTPPLATSFSNYSGRARTYKQGMVALHAYEMDLSLAILKELWTVKGAVIYGISDEERLEERVATYSFTLPGISPREAARKMGEKGINLWDGNYYALAISERLGLEEHGGAIRVGATHYNTREEIERFGAELRKIVS